MPETLTQHIGRYALIFCLLVGFLSLDAFARQIISDSTGTQPVIAPADTSVVDSVFTPTDFASFSTDTTSQTQTERDVEGSGNQTVPEAVKFQSSDSLVVDFRAGRTATLYGAAKVTHESGELTSGKIEMDLDITTVEASTATPEDTLSMPVLKRASDEIRSRRILFNYKTQKGKFEEARINVGEGQLIGSKVKNVNETEVFIEDGIYSTCPPEYLYYYIKAQKMKVVDQDEIFFTNARLYILDIPYPLVFPFGYVPSGIEQKKSGLLTPTYVFDAKSTRGIGLNNVGWFQYINDYLTASLSSDIYTSGTFYLNTVTQYRKSDLFSGSVNLGYSKTQGLEPTDPGFSKTVNRNIAINHSQTISPYASLTANINLRTADFYTENTFDIDQRAEVTSNSRAAYRYNHPENLFNFSTSANLVQDFNDNATTLRGPEATFSLKTISPFQSAGSNSPKWYESVTVRYNNNLRSDFTYKPIDGDTAEVTFFEALTDPEVYREATGNDDYIRAAFQQTGAIGIGKLLNSAFLNASASINVNEYWYPSSIRKSFDEETNSVVTQKQYGFEAARDFSSSVSFSTTLYGISNKKVGNLEGFRHTFTPSFSMSYRPDFSEEIWGYYRTVQSDTLGNTQTYSIFEDEIFTGPSRGESRSLSFSARNVFETKVVKRDSTGEVNERVVKIIDNFSFNTSYNFAADSLNLSNLRASISSNAIKGLDLSVRAEFSFYERKENGFGRINEFVWENGRIAQPENLTISAGTSFRGGARGIEPFTPIYRRVYDPLNQGIFSTVDPGYGYEPVAPLNSPWSVNFSFSYSWRYRFNDSPDRSATLNASNISFNLTPKWKFRTRIGYDFIEKKLTPSQFNLDRNLECWNLSFQINPFGENQYYFFRLSVNSSQIQSLFQKLPILNNLERRSSQTGRSPFGN